jgi:hypothetical protein
MLLLPALMALLGFTENSPRRENAWRIGKPFSSFAANNSLSESSTDMWTGFAKQVAALPTGAAACPFVIVSNFAEEVILAEERTTEEERNHIMEARRRAATKRKKMKSTGKSRSTETDEDEDEPDEGTYLV